MAMKIPRRVALFALIGVFNTLVDFSVYLVAMHFTKNILIANVIATSVAIVVSFVLNSRLTFQIQTLSAGRLAAFIAVTLFGTWVLQTAVIYMLTPAVTQLPASLFAIFGAASLQAERLLPKVLATPVTLVWNYLWYSRVIFVRK